MPPSVGRIALKSIRGRKARFAGMKTLGEQKRLLAVERLSVSAEKNLFFVPKRGSVLCSWNSLIACKSSVASSKMQVVRKRGKNGVGGCGFVVGKSGIRHKAAFGRRQGWDEHPRSQCPLRGERTDFRLRENSVCCEEQLQLVSSK